MSLYGSLSTMPITDLLQWLATAGKTGTLQVERNKIAKWIIMREGRIVGCSSDDGGSSRAQSGGPAGGSLVCRAAGDPTECGSSNHCPRQDGAQRDLAEQNRPPARLARRPG